MAMARRRSASPLALRPPGLAMDFIPESVRRALRRRSTQIIGLAVLGPSLFCLAAMVTWSATDPSLSNASGGAVKNLLGRPGAIASDLLMQLLGLASLAFLLSTAFWGWRLVTARPLHREKLRAGALVAGVLGLCAVLGCLPDTPAWPIPAGLGGAFGDLIPRVIGIVRGGGATLLDTILVGGIGTVLALGGFYLALRRPNAGREDDVTDSRASDYGHDEDEDEEEDAHDRRLISLGAFTHTLLSLKARLMPRRRPVRTVAGDMAAGAPRLEPRVRREPGFDPDARRAPVDVEEPEEAEMYADGTVVRSAAPPPRKPAGRGARAADTPRRRSGVYELPELTQLAAPQAAKGPVMSPEMLQETARLLEGTLDDFGVRGEIIQVRPGPVVTLYELEPAPGIKSSRVIGLADDIARSMSAISARVAVVPGRNAIGIELPNARREKVLLRELLATTDFAESGQKLAIALGKTIGGEPVIVDLARMPHLLVAGTTGSGKSVAINTMILSLLYRLKPEQCRLIMIDPKMLELSVYDGIPHLLAPVVTDPKKAVVALKWAVREMEDRYKKMSKLGVRNIDGFNARIVEANRKGESLARTVQTGFDHETGDAIYEREEMDLSPLPYIVVIVDEMADLMLVAGKDIEGAIQRLAQMARAAGIHLVMATQRPSVDVITGTIKANFPTRISFQVTSKIDSRTILGEMGAEQLLGQGDMLYMAGGGRISRVHGPFVADEEVEGIVQHLKAQGAPSYVEAVTADLDEDGGSDGAVFDKGAFGEEGQDLYSQAVAVVMRDKKCSTSYIQRRLQIGYNRAASLVERMEREGIVAAPNHAGKREILLSDEAAE